MKMLKICSWWWMSSRQNGCHRRCSRNKGSNTSGLTGYCFYSNVILNLLIIEIHYKYSSSRISLLKCHFCTSKIVFTIDEWTIYYSILNLTSIDSQVWHHRHVEAKCGWTLSLIIKSFIIQWFTMPHSHNLSTLYL
jgi:hypothetical protein